jgi:hypothetical protein
MTDERRKASPGNKTLARYAAAAFGGVPHVDGFADRDEKLKVDILYCRNRPTDGVTAYSTIGLSDHPMHSPDGSEFPTRLELSGVCATAVDSFPNILASAAFSVIRTQRVHYPGAVMPDFVRHYGASTDLPHLYLTSPYLWEEQLKTLDCGTKRVSWLLAIPISEAEYGYLKQHGDRELERRLEERKADVSDISRASVV